MRRAPVTYSKRAMLAVQASTTLDAEACAEVVAEAARTHGDAPAEGDGSVELDRSGAKLRVPLARYGHWSLAPEGPPGAPEHAWRAAVSVRPDGERTTLRVGGLTEYWTLPPGPLTPWYVLPGIKPIWRFSAYRRFLWRVAEGIRERDPDAAVETGVPGARLRGVDRVVELVLRTAQATPLVGLAAYALVVLLVARDLGLSPAILLAGGLVAVPFVRGSRHQFASATPPTQAAVDARTVAAGAALTGVMVLTIVAALRLGHEPGVVLILALVSLPLLAMSGRGRGA